MKNKIVPPQLLPGYKTPESMQAELDKCPADKTPFTYMQPVHTGGDLPSLDEYDGLTKAKLLLCIPRKDKICVTDEMCKAKDVVMVRLPPYHCEFNPIEEVWCRTKGAVARRNVNYKLREAMNIMKEESLKITAAEWIKLERHTMKEEEIALAGDAIALDVV